MLGGVRRDGGGRGWGIAWPTLLGEDVEELQAVQLEFEGFVALLRRGEVAAPRLHPLQGWLQVPRLDLHRHATHAHLPTHPHKSRLYRITMTA